MGGLGRVGVGGGLVRWVWIGGGVQVGGGVREGGVRVCGYSCGCAVYLNQIFQAIYYFIFVYTVYHIFCKLLI